MVSKNGSISLVGQDILITGGAGFIGSAVANALVPDNEVRVFDNLSNGRKSNVPDEATLIKGDIRNETDLKQAIDGVDIIFHQAGQISVEKSVDRPKETHDINVTATLNVLECAREENAKLIFASSAAVYGQPEEIPISENASTDPTSPYGLSKLAAEKYVRLYAELYDLSTVAFRYFNVYGPGQVSGDYNAVISVFVEQATSGEPITVEGDGTQTRDFVHVQDIVRANLLAAQSDVTGVFNVGTGRSVSVLDLAKTVRDVIDSESEITHVAERSGDIEHSHADISRIKTTLGFEPSISLEEGLKTLVEQE